jgi:hypothetical protein
MVDLGITGSGHAASFPTVETRERSVPQVSNEPTWIEPAPLRRFRMLLVMDAKDLLDQQVTEAFGPQGSFQELVPQGGFVTRSTRARATPG